MTRLSALLTAICLAAIPEALSCAEATPADATVHARDEAKASLVRVAEIDITYGFGAQSLGFSLAGGEREALGPCAIEVLDDGTIRLADTLRRALFDVRVDAQGRPSVTPAGALPRRIEARSSGLPAVARAIKTSGEDGAIIFTENGAQHRVAVATGGPLAAIRLIGVDRSGRAFAVVERYRELGKTAIDREVIVVDRSGALVAKLALPEVPAVRPVVELFLAPDGALYRLAADADLVRVTRYEVRP
jgi:hypothetical protein